MLKLIIMSTRFATNKFSGLNLADLSAIEPVYGPNSHSNLRNMQPKVATVYATCGSVYATESGSSLRNIWISLPIMATVYAICERVYVPNSGISLRNMRVSIRTEEWYCSLRMWISLRTQ